MDKAEIASSFDPHAVEDKWYRYWIENEFFKGEASSDKKPFSIVIPPPNITGSLHMGHALNNTLQDILIRYKRMDGFNPLWMPGTDHAGIATQNVVEKQLAEKNMTRHDLGREAFIKMVWKWRKESGGTIINQLKKLGASCDWSRERFTMDEGLSAAVKEVFIRLFNEGLIYRERRLINWCPRCLTALSDLEVEHEEVSGTLTYIRYPFADGKGCITVATTRPETMLGDTAVAVNPSDERYKDAIGKNVRLPLTSRVIPVIADETVDSEFGTGAVKITPAHDFNDEITGKKQNLEFITVIDAEGKMTADAGEEYKGLDRFSCRKKVVSDLEILGLIEKIEPYKTSIGCCYRCKTVVEPYLTLQWFVNVKSMAKEAIKAVRDGKTKIIPKTWENTYFNWMENIKDWCISRQIWWGHQVPVWYCKMCDSDNIFFFLKGADNETSISGTVKHFAEKGFSFDELMKKADRYVIGQNAAPYCSKEKPEKCLKCSSSDFIQDPDVLDTWFSSALWPFSTFGWPENTGELKTFYPTSVLVTGFDILFFWVARMMMMGLKFMEDVPFKDVYIHALVRDAQGHKMSKSKGNVIDPLTVIDEYGTDAFRFTLAAFAAQGRDVRLSTERIEGYRNFANKIWNASRLLLMNLEPDFKIEKPEMTGLRLREKWILTLLNRTISEVREALDSYRFNDAASSIYQFFWHQLCDWYLELIKPALYKKEEHYIKAVNCAVFVLKESLKLLHPFMPYITEEIWHKLPGHSQTITKSSFPSFDSTLYDEEAYLKMEKVMNVIKSIRTIRGEMNVSPSKEITANIFCLNEASSLILQSEEKAIKALARLKTAEIKTADKTFSEGGARIKNAATSVVEDIEIYLPFQDLIEIDDEVKRLNKEIYKIRKELDFVNGKLSNKEFVEKAPSFVVEKEKTKAIELNESLRKLSKSLEMLKS